MKGISMFKPPTRVNPKATPVSCPDNNFLANLKVYTSTGESVLLGELWEDCTVILKVLPRLGCKFCKYEARTLDDLGFLVDPNKVKMVAVCFTDPDLDTFLSNGYWSWSIFLDPHREVYRRAQLYRVSKWEMFKELVTKRVRILSKFIDKRYHLPNSVKGDPYQLGGTFIIAPGGQLLFQFRPTKIAMYPSIKEMYATIGGDPEEIDEITPVVYSELQANDLFSVASSASSIHSRLSYQS